MIFRTGIVQVIEIDCQTVRFDIIIKKKLDEALWQIKKTLRVHTKLLIKYCLKNMCRQDVKTITFCYSREHHMFQQHKLLSDYVYNIRKKPKLRFSASPIQYRNSFFFTNFLSIQVIINEN